MPKNCYQPFIVQGLPGFPGLPGSGSGGGGGALQNRILQVATGYSSDPLENYQFLTIQSAIDYATSQSPTFLNTFTIYIASGTYEEDITLSSNINIEGVNPTAVYISGNININLSGPTFTTIENIINLSFNSQVSTNLIMSGSTIALIIRNSSLIVFSYEDNSINDSNIQIFNSTIQNITGNTGTNPNSSLEIFYSNINTMTITDSQSVILGSLIAELNIGSNCEAKASVSRIDNVNLTGTGIFPRPFITAENCALNNISTAAGTQANILSSKYMSLIGAGSIDRTQTFQVTGVSPINVPFIVPYLDTSYSVFITQVSVIPVSYSIDNKLVGSVDIIFLDDGVQTFDVLVTRTTSSIN